MNSEEYRKSYPDWKVITGSSAISAVIEKSYEDGRLQGIAECIALLESYEARKFDDATLGHTPNRWAAWLREKLMVNG